MADVDLSVIVTAHNETVVAGPTMKSADDAIAAAEAHGITVEKIIALDSATPACSTFFNQPAFDSWTRIPVEQRDLGRTRNELISRCAGANIAFLDSDDLFSENWLSEGMRVIHKHKGEKIIVHPELNWLFDGAQSILVNVDQASEHFVPEYFYFKNYYDSLCLTPREAHLEVPYVHRDIPRGLSFQDWQFAIETMAKGWKHLCARDTIIFKRRRDSSLVTESSGRQAIVRQLEVMAIDRVRELGRNDPPNL